MDNDKITRAGSDDALMEEYQREMAARVAEEGPLPTVAEPEITDAYVERCLNNNELGDGILFAALHRNKHIYVGQAGEWMYWDGHHWHIDDIDKAHRALADVENVSQEYLRVADAYEAKRKEAERADDKKLEERLKNKAELLRRRVNRLRSQAGRLRCLDFAKTNSVAPLAIRGDEIDRAPWMLPVANGVIDLRTGDLTAGRPEDYLLRYSPIRWEGIDAPCPEWERYVTEVMGDDPEMAAFLQRVFGYGITGLSREHVFLVLYGRGRNGKSIMVEIIQQVLGVENGAAALAAPVQSEMLLEQGKNRNASGPTPDIMALRGLRIAVASETDEGQKFSSSRVKWFSGGDTLTGRSPYDKRLISFQPTHLLCLLTNNKPHAPANDFPFWERLLLVDFPISFVDRAPQNENERRMDKGLKDRLLQELPGILAWLVRGCLAWQEKGLDPPVKVRDAIAAYRRDEDLLADFIEDACTLYPDAPEQRTSATDLYDAFCHWFRESVSAKKTIAQKRFSKMMQERFKRERKGGIYYYYGIGVTQQYENRMLEARDD